MSIWLILHLICIVINLAVGGFMLWSDLEKYPITITNLLALLGLSALGIVLTSGVLVIVIIGGILEGCNWLVKFCNKTVIVQRRHGGVIK